MPTPADSTPPPAGDDRPLSNTEPGTIELPLEERLRQMWEKHRGWIVALCLAVLAVIVGRSIWQIIQERRAASTAQAYAAARDSGQLKAFAAEHDGVALAGVAHLRLADEAYAAARYSEAVSAYNEALETLDGTPLVARARLGVAMATLKSGQEDAGRSALQALADDAQVPATLRSEALYHLASLAAGAGQTDQVNRLLEQLNAIDGTSLWAQRASALRTGDAAPAASATGDDAAVSFPGTGQ